MKWWNALSGKKTVIGGVFLLASTVITELVIGQWGINAEILPKITGTFDWIGMALGGVGLLHKGKKKLLV